MRGEDKQRDRAGDRALRLGEALRANLTRRKAQARARGAGTAEPQGPKASQASERSSAED
jgi:hypothetical protein